MTPELQDIKKSQVSQKLSNGTMTITRKCTSQQITGQGWSAETHSIVYNVATADLKAFTAYRTVASPTESQAKAAQDSVFRAAKLALPFRTGKKAKAKAGRRYHMPVRLVSTGCCLRAPDLLLMNSALRMLLYLSLGLYPL